MQACITVCTKSFSRASKLNATFVVCSYWDSSYDEDLMEDRVAMNLLFLQVKYQLKATVDNGVHCDKMNLTMAIVVTRLSMLLRCRDHSFSTVLTELFTFPIL